MGDSVGSQPCSCRASAQGPGSHPRHRDHRPGTRPGSTTHWLGELRARLPHIIKGSLEDHLSLCLDTSDCRVEGAFWPMGQL